MPMRKLLRAAHIQDGQCGTVAGKRMRLFEKLLGMKGCWQIGFFTNILFYGLR